MEEADPELLRGREPFAFPFSPAKAREKMRVRLGIVVIFGMLAAAAAGVVSALTSGPGTDEILTGVFSPLLGLSGAVIGFYFGGKDSSV